MTESSIWVPFKETEFDEKIENRVLIQDSELVPVLSFAQTFKNFEKLYFIVCIWIAWIQ